MSARRRDLPPVSEGLKVGLLGGSFDPPHAGHLHISSVALRRLGLDRVWWLVSPGNPLKDRGPAEMQRRLEASHALIGHRQDILATDLEAQLGTRYTADTLRKIRRFYPRVRFVWLMGADNMAQIHLWRDWADIFCMVPVAVLARPGNQVGAGLSAAARRFAGARLSSRRATALPYREPPCWTLMSHPTSSLSSTQIRAAGGWP